MHTQVVRIKKGNKTEPLGRPTFKIIVPEINHQTQLYKFDTHPSIGGIDFHNFKSTLIILYVIREVCRTLIASFSIGKGFRFT